VDAAARGRVRDVYEGIRTARRLPACSRLIGRFAGRTCRLAERRRKWSQAPKPRRNAHRTNHPFQRKARISEETAICFEDKVVISEISAAHRRQSGSRMYRYEMELTAYLSGYDRGARYRAKAIWKTLEICTRILNTRAYSTTLSVSTFGAISEPEPTKPVTTC